MTRQEFSEWLSSDSYHVEGDKKPQQMQKEDDENLCTAQAILLLDHLDPSLFAIQASGLGIVIYPRHHIHQLTTWEQTLLRSEWQIPAEWIGGLEHTKLQLQEECKRRSTTSGMQQSKSRDRAASGRAQVVAFSLTRFSQRMQEFLSVGATTGTKSTLDAFLSTSKEPSGRRRWQRSEKPSSST